MVNHTVILGAGLVGSSIAMHLAKLRGTGHGITVVDFDLEGSLSSSELNAGAVRATFSQPINILFSKLSIEFFEKHALDVGYKACGYLWLRDPEQMKATEKYRKTQVGLGWNSELLDVKGIQKKAPFLDKCEGLAGAQFAPRDGLINPNLLKQTMRREARALGVHFLDRHYCVGATHSKTHWTLDFLKFARNVSEEGKKEVLSGHGVTGHVEKTKLQSYFVVNATGAWAGSLAKALGYQLPTKPVRRQVCIFDSNDVDLTPYGMIVDSSGVYFHPEATNGLAGVALNSDPEGFNFEYEGAKFFEEKIWPALYERSTSFERLRHITGWAGLYEVSPDESAIMGKVSDGLYECHSFSGHGAMHSYAAGLCLAELIEKGKYLTIDASVLSRERFNQGKDLREGAVI